MFNALLLVQDDGACAAMEKLALESKQVAFLKTLYRFPQAFELSKMLNTLTPDLVFLDLSDWDSALAAAADIRELSPHTPMIGFGAGWEPGKEKQCMAGGITTLLVSPVNLENFQESVDRAIHKVRGAVQENLFAFLPAKAGSGCTTIALNTAGYLADTSGKDPLAKKVLLIEGDLRSGVLSVLLDIRHPYSLRDALNDSERLDYSSWTKFVVRSGGIDLLVSRQRHEGPLPSWNLYHDLLNFAASRYDNILVDLPEVVNDATVEIVRRAERVFVVCTPELPSMALAPRVFSVGGRLGYIDDGETPNTMVIYHDYPGAALIFEVRGLPSKSGSKEMDHYKGVRSGVGISIECEGGQVAVPSYNAVTAYDNDGKVIKEFKGSEEHHENWLKAVRNRRISTTRHCKWPGPACGTPCFRNWTWSVRGTGISRMRTARPRPMPCVPRARPTRASPEPAAARKLSSRSMPTIVCPSVLTPLRA